MKLLRKINLSINVLKYKVRTLSELAARRNTFSIKSYVPCIITRNIYYLLPSLLLNLTIDTMILIWRWNVREKGKSRRLFSTLVHYLALVWWRQMPLGYNTVTGWAGSLPFPLFKNTKLHGSHVVGLKSFFALLRVTVFPLLLHIADIHPYLSEYYRVWRLRIHKTSYIN